VSQNNLGAGFLETATRLLVRPEALQREQKLRRDREGLAAFVEAGCKERTLVQAIAARFALLLPGAFQSLCRKGHALARYRPAHIASASREAPSAVVDMQDSSLALAIERSLALAERADRRSLVEKNQVRGKL
jgi:hypothetical protein